jgi:hypothetical protein
MHPYLIHELARSRSADYEHEAARATLARQARPVGGHERQSLRMMIATRAAALAALYLLAAATIV